MLQPSRETVIYIFPYSQPPDGFVTVLWGRPCWVISGISPSYFYSLRSHGKQEFYPRQLVFRILPLLNSRTRCEQISHWNLDKQVLKLKPYTPAYDLV